MVGKNSSFSSRILWHICHILQSASNTESHYSVFAEEKKNTKSTTGMIPALLVRPECSRQEGMRAKVGMGSIKAKRVGVKLRDSTQETTNIGTVPQYEAQGAHILPNCSSDQDTDSGTRLTYFQILTPNLTTFELHDLCQVTKILSHDFYICKLDTVISSISKSTSEGNCKT